eukprot:150527_1
MSPITNTPTYSPMTSNPTISPIPSTSPTYNPSKQPTNNPSIAPVTSDPTISPTKMTSIIPTRRPTLCPLKEYENILEIVIFYNDNNPTWYQNYFSLLVYYNLMIEAILTSIQQSTSTSYSICDFQMCSIFNTDIDKNCTNYIFGDDTPFRWEYIAFGIFRANMFKDNIVKLMNSKDFIDAFTKNMNNLLNDRIDINQNRRNLLGDNFEAISVIVFDSTEKDEKEQTSDKGSDNNTIIIVVVVLILILIGIAIGIAFYLRNRNNKLENNENGDNVNEAIQLTGTDAPNTTTNVSIVTDGDTEGTGQATFAE